MKAVFVHDEAGSRQLSYGDLPDPQPLPGEIVVRLKAAALNRMDLYMRDSGAGVTHALPFVLGGDGAGEVVQAAKGGRVKVGQRVLIYPAVFDPASPASLAGDQTLSPTIAYLGLNRSGTFAELIALPEHCVVPLPDGTDLTAMAVMPVAYLTAYRMVFGGRGIQPGQTMLIMGIGGGVAVACLQLAVLAGANVIVTSSSAEKLDRARTLGASHGINRVSEKVADRVMDITQRRGVDVVIDSVGEATWADGFRSVRAGGRIVIGGATSGAVVSLNLQRLFARQIEIRGSTLGSFQEFASLVDLASRGKIAPVVDEIVPMAEIQTALARLQDGERFGKIGLSIG